MKNPAEELVRLGMSTEHAAPKAPRFLQCTSALAGAGADPARYAIWVPGRIEVFGKHTDYAGGRSLMCAIERGLCLCVAPRRDRVVRVIDILRGDEFATALDPTSRGPQGAWGAYVAAVARRFARDLPTLTTGVDVVFASDLPSAAGLSSSSALVVATALALLAVNGHEPGLRLHPSITTPEALAGYLGAVENGAAFADFPGDQGVGTFGGSEDHTAILCCRAGSVSQFSYAPVVREADIVVPADLTFVVGVSGVTASKTGNARQQYNRLALAASRLVTAWNRHEHRHDATLAAALRSSPGAVERLRAVARRGGDTEFGSEELADRLEQFIEESDLLVPSAAGAIRRSALAELGVLADRSEQLAEDRLGNQVSETVMLQRLARVHGAVAASAFGGGFGGSVWAMVPREQLVTFVTQWEQAYRARNPRAAPRSEFFATRAGPPATVWQC